MIMDANEYSFDMANCSPSSFTQKKNNQYKPLINKSHIHTHEIHLAVTEN